MDNQEKLEDNRIFKIANKIFSSSGFTLFWDKEKDIIIAQKKGRQMEIKFELLRKL